MHERCGVYIGTYASCNNSYAMLLAYSVVVFKLICDEWWDTTSAFVVHLPVQILLDSFSYGTLETDCSLYYVCCWN